MKGIICINKPFGLTSFHVIAKLRKILNFKKIGHCGTLDPIATGVLPIFLGKATKAIQFLPDTDKIYLAGFKLGEMTDSFDFTGTTLSKKKSNVIFNKLNSYLAQFQGTTLQTPPKFSAVKIGGVPAYKLARCGANFLLKAKKINVTKIYCKEFDECSQCGIMYVHCSSGTYVRSICNDLGLKLGVGCVMTSLVRVKACGFSLSDCYSLTQVEQAMMDGKISDVVLSLGNVFKNFKYKKINLNERLKFLNGASIKIQNTGNFIQDELVSVFFDDEFLGLSRFKDGFLFVEKLFV